MAGNGRTSCETSLCFTMIGRREVALVTLSGLTTLTLVAQGQGVQKGRAFRRRGRSAGEDVQQARAFSTRTELQSASTLNSAASHINLKFFRVPWGRSEASH